MQPNLNMVIEQVGKDKGIDRKVLVQTLEQAILTAAKRAFGQNRELEAQYNPDTGAVDLYMIVNVVEEVADPGREISIELASTHGLESQVGDELLFQIFYRPEDTAQADEQEQKFGDLLGMRDAYKGFGRIAAQTAKQVIIQRVREAERENVFNEYKDRKGELITGIVRRFERGNIIVDLGRAEAILPVREQVPRESYRAGDRIVAFVVDIEKNARGPQIVLSRTNNGLLEKLFEMEVPEIYEKIVRLEASAREPGARAKIAVSSRDRDVDPVGACVGMKGSRVQAVVQELRGEKIDIVPYSDDPARFVCNAIAPAEVSRVLIDAETHTMELIVPDDKLSLAIGKKGQNVRLASQLTGWRIDIHSESKVKELEVKARRSLSLIDGMDEEMASTLFKLGWRSAQDVMNARPDDIAKVPGMGGLEKVTRIVAAAAKAVETEKARAAEEAARMAVEAKKSDRDRLLGLPRIDESLAERLEGAGYRSVQAIAAEDGVTRLCEAVGIDEEHGKELHHAARLYVAEFATLLTEGPAPAPAPERA